MLVMFSSISMELMGVTQKMSLRFELHKKENMSEVERLNKLVVFLQQQVNCLQQENEKLREGSSNTLCVVVMVVGGRENGFRQG